MTYTWNMEPKHRICQNSFYKSVGNKAKGGISKRVFQESKARHIFRKTNISYLLIHKHFFRPDTHMCAYQGVRNVRFSENVARFVFLKHPFWDSLFCLVTDELKWKSKKFIHLVFSPKFILFLDYKLMSCQNDSFQCISAWYLSKSKRKLPVLFFGYSILAIFLRPHDVR